MKMVKGDNVTLEREKTGVLDLAFDVHPAKCGLFRRFEQVAGLASQHADVVLVSLLEKCLAAVPSDELEA